MRQELFTAFMLEEKREPQTVFFSNMNSSIISGVSSEESSKGFGQNFARRREEPSGGALFLWCLQVLYDGGDDSVFNCLIIQRQ